MILSSKTTNHSLSLFIRLTGFPAEKIFCRRSYFMRPRGPFSAAGGTTIILYHPRDNLVVAKIILLDPRDCEGETQYARFWGREAACKQISQFGKKQQLFGKHDKKKTIIV